MGGTFRIGVEDACWLYPHEYDLIFSNAEAVELAIDVAENLGREVITDPDEAWDYLGIEYPSPRLPDATNQIGYINARYGQ